MKKNINSGRAFTIVELLVVISIIAILLALLAPALGGVIRRSKKFTETNALRNVGQAWILYANSNAEYVLPGYLDPLMQGASPGWDVQYEYPYVPSTTNPNNPPGVVIDPLIAATWTWRLMPYLSYNHDMIHDHTDEPNRSSMNILEEAEAIANEPGFGYNAYYVGGWWDIYEVGNQNIARYRFWQATADLDGDDNIDDDEKAKVVVRSIGQCRRSTEVVVFCSSSNVNPGVYKEWEDDQPGSHYVVPPFLAEVEHWGRAGGGSGGIGGNSGVSNNTTFRAAAGDFWTVEAFLQTSVPIGRYTKSSNVLYFDGHTANQAVGVLLDMRNWIDIATTRDFRHNE